MTNERWLEIGNSDLAKALSRFIDGNTDEDVIREISSLCSRGYSERIHSEIKTITEFIDADPDLIWVRDFVDWEINYNLDGATGKKQLEWIVNARGLMKKALEENKDL